MARNKLDDTKSYFEPRPLTDITDSVDVVECSHRDVSGGRCDSAEIVLENAYAWYRWNPQRDDAIEIVQDQYTTGRLYLSAVYPEDGRYKILATSLPSSARRKANAAYANMRLDDIAASCAAECGMGSALYGLDEDTVYACLTLWLYQHLWAVLVPNKKQSNLLARIQHFENNIVFHKQKEGLLTISKKIDLVVLDDKIITSNIPLMQKSFGFQDYIRATAERTITKVSETGFVSNPDKLTEYVNRGNGQPKYAKKLMRIADSKVLLMTPGRLIERIASVERWRGMFVVNASNHTIELQTYVHVERFIDLLDERFTKSEITDTEYDTDVKKEASPVEQETDQ